MVNKLIVAIFLSLVCNAFALNSHYSPVLIFKHKENTNSYEKTTLSTTNQIEKREFEQRLESLVADQKLVICVVPDLSPEDLAHKNEEHVKAFQNIANGVDIVDYMLFVQNAVDNKVTQDENVAYTSVSTVNDFEPEPSSDKKIIIAKLPGYHEAEPRFHWLSRIDRALYAISQLPQYKDCLFILTSEMNSRLEQQQQQEHLRKRRDAKLEPPYKLDDANVLFYAKDFVQDFKKEGQADKPIKITGLKSTKNGDNEITVDIESDFPLSLKFDYSPDNDYWELNAAKSTIKSQPLEGKVSANIGAPLEFSYSCSTGTYFGVNDTETNGVYFKGFQIQFNFASGPALKSFSDSYDCIGFTSAGIWAGLFITFLLLGIVSIAITYIMDIRTMDRFDDPKGKTITVTASD